MREELSKDYFLQLETFLSQQSQKPEPFYPAVPLIFRALSAVSPHKVKVVILGQDPYHGPEQAEGLSFSVPNNIQRPPSLKNIFKELSTDLNTSLQNLEKNSLLPWAHQGVLLLNSVLTVKKGCPASHADKGWETFTTAIINKLNDQYDNLVFILWGAYAQKKAQCIDKKKHLVLCSAHPSPLSAYRGFFGSKVFSKTSTYLVQKNKTPVNWLSVKGD